MQLMAQQVSLTLIECIWRNNHFIYHTVVDDDTDLSSPAELTLVFPAGTNNQQRCIDIFIASDTLLEGYQEFTVTITGAGIIPHALISPSSSVTTVIITDDESEYNNFLLVADGY